MNEPGYVTVDVVVSDAAVRESTRILLDINEYDGQNFTSGTEFILAGRHTDCLLTDRILSDMTGLDLLEHLRVSGDATPAVMMTGRIDAEMAAHAGRLSLALIEKPPLSDSLLDSIRDACRHSASCASAHAVAVPARFPAALEATEAHNPSWIDHAGTGVAIFDAEHRKLNELVMDYYDAILAGEEEGSLNKLLQKLAEETEWHFTHEENYMRFTGFDDGGHHVETHRRLSEALRRVPTLARSSEESRTFAALAVLRFLKHWLIGHIVNEDRALGAFLNSKGIR